MRRIDSGSRLVMATHNAGKAREIAELLSPFKIDVVTAGSLGLPEPDETGDSFAANAEIKAEAAAKASGFPALADDSGLVITTLDGAPGIYSARWAGPTKDFNLAMERVEKELVGKADRRAHFTCALALCWPDGFQLSVEGHVHGTLVWPMRGQKGFGYDPMFLPDGSKLTFGEMAPEAKHAISHRAAAFRRLVDMAFG
jgi:XTP/dITP diphosphohydrolase